MFSPSAGRTRILGRGRGASFSRAAGFQKRPLRFLRGEWSRTRYRKGSWFEDGWGVLSGGVVTVVPQPPATGRHASGMRGGRVG